MHQFGYHQAFFLHLFSGTLEKEVSVIYSRQPVGQPDSNDQF